MQSKCVGRRMQCRYSVLIRRYHAGRTLAVKECSAPVWRETLFLYVRDLGKQNLTVHVEHACREPEGRNVLLGSAQAPDLAALCDGEVHDLHLELQGCAAGLPATMLLVSAHSPGKCQGSPLSACMHLACTGACQTTPHQRLSFREVRVE